MFGQAKSGHDVREPRITELHELVAIAIPLLHDRVCLLCIEWVPDRRFEWLVMGWKGPVYQPGRSEQPPLAVQLHDERVGPGVAVKPDSVRVGRRGGRFGEGEVRRVVAGPALPVPPDP